ncbi:MAG: J domain-containing protein [Terriglobales bacterium]
MKDYHAILGLDAEASPESIKVAYRRLATQFHPDRMTGASAEELARCSDRMREINEAYSVLIKRVRPPAARPSPGNGAAREPAKVERARTAAARADTSAVFSSVSGELSEQIRRGLSNSPMRWHEDKWEGFDWAMVSTSLLSKHSVALRGFPSVDLDVTTKFTNYAQVAIDRSSRYRRNYYVFLLAVHRIARAEDVIAACRQFCYANRGGKVAEIEIAVIDVGNAKSVLCGPKVRDERYGRLLRQLGFSMR